MKCIESTVLSAFVSTVLITDLCNPMSTSPIPFVNALPLDISEVRSLLFIPNLLLLHFALLCKTEKL